MPQHGDYEKDSNRWFCSYWMTMEEWKNIHNYAPKPDSVNTDKQNKS
jgi:hypothetical protein